MNSEEKDAGGWKVSVTSDVKKFDNSGSVLLTARIHVASLLCKEGHFDAYLEGDRSARTALADFVGRKLSEVAVQWNEDAQTNFTIVPLANVDDDSLKRRRRKNTDNCLFVLERSDIWCSNNFEEGNECLCLCFRLKTRIHGENQCDEASFGVLGSMNWNTLSGPVGDFLLCFKTRIGGKDLIEHICVVTLQQRLRSILPELSSVAFICDGSILPRRSGVSNLPMESPPAIPFQAPDNSPMKKMVAVEMGAMHSFLHRRSSSNSGLLIEKRNSAAINASSTPEETKGSDDLLVNKDDISPTCTILTGLLVPTGVTLIVGGGYHGKSTLLRAIATGIYDKIPGDGRELCVTVSDAVSVRAEDGRSINGCNISAFISNLPLLNGISTSPPNNGECLNEDGSLILKKHEEAPDVLTRYFKTREASGSTSQASNVVEAIESGASCMLIDEDVSAANFMARDGRMRALVMDESITPLLYRVNGMFDSLKISTIVVVGGVGDWLDVPHQVLLLDRYVISDATTKARSISAQFSYGHVQYAGRGVVHRLPWKDSGTPHTRRPDNPRDFVESTIEVCPNSTTMTFVNQNESEENIHDNLGEIEMGRCEQLYGKSRQLFGCGVMVKYALKVASMNEDLGIRDILDACEKEVDKNGLRNTMSIHDLGDCISDVGYALRPRKHEVAMALCRMRGLNFAEVKINDINDAEMEMEEERRNRELAELWNNRRGKSRN